MSNWPFGDLKPFSYDLLMVDPPWPTTLRSPKGEGKSFTRHYGAMNFEQIAALPVGQLASPNSVLVLWGTWGLLLDGGDPKRHFAGADAGRSRIGAVMREWGFRYVTGGPWLKRTKTGKLAFGCGYRLRDCNEPFLLGVIGAPLTSKRERNLIDGLRREHSRKPEEAFAWCERLMPHARRVELFSRQSRPHWDSWGFEAGKFDPVVNLGEAA